MKFRFYASVLAIFFLGGCPTAPPATTPAPAGVDGAVVPPTRETLTLEEIKEVEDAIKVAEELDAARFSPAALAEAQNNLANAKRQGSGGQVTEGRASLAAARAAAERAQTEARTGILAAERKRLQDAHNLLLGVDADKYTPEAYDGLRSQYQLALAAVESGDLAVARPMSNEAVRAMINHRDSLEARINTIASLRSDATLRLNQAESGEAYIWAPDALEGANNAFLKGVSAQRKFNLDASEEAFTQARYLALLAIERSRGGTSARRTQALMEATRQAIERASRLTVVDDDNNVIPPQPWDGTKILEERQKRPPQPEGPQSFLLEEGRVLVLQEIRRVTYLTLAQEAWIKGLEEKERGNYPVADEYFSEAMRLVLLYEAMAVEKLHTVRLIPERRESLWRISEYQAIFGDPLQWPRIWYRNRRLVQNPDLIFPGWQLIIPPQ